MGARAALVAAVGVFTGYSSRRAVAAWRQEMQVSAADEPMTLALQDLVPGAELVTGYAVVVASVDGEGQPRHRFYWLGGLDARVGLAHRLLDRTVKRFGR